ncbi:Glucuronosyltransferase [Aphelenchoides fujianensis]|nr:Glucuronosyltransferase [Aphelenchoides fujianensis]
MTADLPRLLFFFALLLAGLPESDGLKFLVYSPRFGLSHVVFQPVNNPQFNSTGTKKAKVIVREADYPIAVDVDDFGKKMWLKKSFMEMMANVNVMGTFFADSCEHQIKDETMMQRLHMCSLLVFEKIGIKFAVTYAAALPQMMTSAIGIPLSTNIPGMMTENFPPLGFKDRMANLLFETVGANFFKSRVVGPMDRMARREFGADFDIMKKAEEAQLYFTNADEFVEYARPISSKVKFIGGIGLKKPKPLTPKYQKIMDESKKGVIFVSFGTVCPSSLMPDNVKQAFLGAFDAFPRRGSIERPEDEIAKGHPNVFTETFWPQTDLLAHPKTIAFVTHGGANSLAEASALGCPLCVTNPRHAVLVEYRKIGVKVDATNITTENLVHAFGKLINEPLYRKNAKELARIIREKPNQPEEEFVRYCEFAAKHDLASRLEIEARFQTIHRNV